jgi:X-Pro dipeptidyl-peptidase
MSSLWRSRASRRYLAASVVALTSAALAVGPGLGAAQARPSAAQDARPAIQHPVFKNGKAMPVFTESPAEYVEQELWVTADTDSDHDGKKDLIHIDVTRVKETEHGLKVPVLFEASPYYAGIKGAENHNVDHKLYAPRHRFQISQGADDWGYAGGLVTHHGPGVISGSLIAQWVPRGFAVVHAESEGTGGSEGCPTSGGPNETLGIKAVIDWLNGRTTAQDADGKKVEAYWTTGKVGMIGTSYNGTLPNAVAATGVEGLDAIIPVSGISSWYDYYRANGAVVAPGTYQGEDLDVLAKAVYTRADQDICLPVFKRLVRQQDRKTGDYSKFWDVRNYVKDAANVHAGVLVAHGLSDWNVKTTHAAQWYEALKAAGVPHRIYWHQGGHGGDPPLQLQVRWFTHFLFGRDNGVEKGSLAWVQRENGAITKYAEWPDPDTKTVTMTLTPRGDGATGGLEVQKGALNAQGALGKAVVETFTDTPDLTAAALAGAPDSPNGRVYVTKPLDNPVRLSGTAVANLRLFFGQYAANVSVALADLDGDGNVTRLVTEGWRDPQNRGSLSRTHIVHPGVRYSLSVPMQANDYVFAKGHRIAFVLLQTDHEYTIRPPAGNKLSLLTGQTTLELPIVGGMNALGG